MMDTTTKDFLLQLKDILQDWKKIEHSEEYRAKLSQVGKEIEQNQDISAGFVTLAELAYKINRQSAIVDRLKDRNYTRYIEKKENISIFKSDISKLIGSIVETIKQYDVSGNEEAQLLLGVMYAYGIGIVKDDEHAIKIIESMATDEYPFCYDMLSDYFYDKKEYNKEFYYLLKYSKLADDAEVEAALGNIYFKGEGTEKNYEKAYAHFQKAADKNQDYAILNLGIMYYKGFYVKKDEAMAVKYFVQSADLGNIDAKIWLGKCYLLGTGLNKNYDKGFKIMSDIWKQTRATGAALFLGNCYAKGWGIPADLRQAKIYYEEAANKGDSNGQLELGSLYHKGKGVQKNYTEAVKWFRKAAVQDNATAQFCIGFYYFSGYGVSQDYEEAVKWFRKAAVQDNEEGMNYLGFCYENGQGVSQDYRLAKEWYLKAAEKGLAVAENNLGNLYFDGLGVEKNNAEAVKWYRKAAAQENPIAQLSLGCCYHQGIYVNKNYTKAVTLFKKAAEQNEYMETKAAGEKWLGICYHNGDGVPKNMELAKQYLLKAKEHGDEEAQDILDNMNNSSSSSDCFITTATCVSLGKPDDCYELNTFRNFRDSWLLKRFYGRLGFKIYYWLAPKMVAHINTLPNSSAIYRQTWEQYLKPCLHLLEQKKYYKAMGLYITMAIRLKVKF